MRVILLAGAIEGATEPGHQATAVVYEGQAGSLKYVDHWRGAGSVDSLLQGHMTLDGDANRIMYLMPDQFVYWFRVVAPFKQRKKIEAILPMLLEEEWPGDVEDLAVRFDVGEQTEEGYTVDVCCIETERLAAVQAWFQEQNLTLDGLVAPSAAVQDVRSQHPVVLLEDGWVATSSYTYGGLQWSGLAFDGAVSVPADQLQQAGQFVTAMARGVRDQPPGYDSSRMLVGSMIGQAPEALRGEGLFDLPPVAQVASTEVDGLDLGLFDRVAYLAVGGSPFNFVKTAGGFSLQLKGLDSVGIKSWLSLAAALVIVIAASWVSVGQKQAEAAQYRDYYRAVFRRMFPSEDPGKNVVKQARKLLDDGGAGGIDRVRGQPVLVVMDQIRKNLPSQGKPVLEKVEVIEGSWNLAGRCADYGCVDAIKAGLDKDFDNVKLNSAKQTIKKDAVRFSISAEERR